MGIVPDTKDWTWVITRPCADCGYDASLVGRTMVAPLLRDNVRTWLVVLTRPHIAVRPDEATWSPLEYGCHVRDVFRVFSSRLDLMRSLDDPLFPNWDQDETAISGDYRAQHPSSVAASLETSGMALAEEFSGVQPSEWSRTGRRTDGASFTVETLALYLLHDVSHHVWDVRPATQLDS